MERHCIEIQWQVEGLGEMTGDDANLGKCKVVVNCLENFERSILLAMEHGMLNLSLWSTEPAVRLPAVEWSACLVTNDGQRWRSGQWKSEEGRPQDSSTKLQSWDLAKISELDEEKLLFEGLGRVSVRVRPIDASNSNCSCTYFARSKVGVSREITWKVEKFSTIGSRTDDENFSYFPQFLSRDKNEIELEMRLSLQGREEGSVCIDMEERHDRIYYVIVDEVSLLRSDESKEECWKREARAAIPGDATVPFIGIQKLMEDKANLLPQDTLTLYVKFRDFYNVPMCYAGEMVEGVIPEFPVLPPPDSQMESTSSLSHDMEALLDSGSHSDFTLRAGGEDIPVIKSLLCAHSPVFRAMLESPAWLEAERKSVDVDDFGPDAVRLMVRYLYSGRVPQQMDVADAAELYAIADKYAVLGLRAHCARILDRDLRADTVCAALRLAERHSDTGLKARVLAYMSANQRAVFLSDEWEAFMQEDPPLALEVEHEVHMKKFKSN